VEENVDGGNRATLSKGKKSTQASPSGRTAKDSGKSGSVRSAPPQAVAVHIDPRDPKLAMTPENIRPLLENAREVHARLDECIGEMRMLLLAKPGLSLDA
jgi:hypothetical protein